MITLRLQIKPSESLRSEGCVPEKDSDFQNDPLYLKGTRMRECGVDILGCDRLAFNPLETVISFPVLANGSLKSLSLICHILLRRGFLRKYFSQYRILILTRIYLPALQFTLSYDANDDRRRRQFSRFYAGGKPRCIERLHRRLCSPPLHPSENLLLSDVSFSLLSLGVSSTRYSESLGSGSSPAKSYCCVFWQDISFTRCLSPPCSVNGS